MRDVARTGRGRVGIGIIWGWRGVGIVAALDRFRVISTRRSGWLTTYWCGDAEIRVADSLFLERESFRWLFRQFAGGVYPFSSRRSQLDSTRSRWRTSGPLM